jgi:hypothetical protein
MDARKKDGDWHVQLDLNQEFSSLLNQANFPCTRRGARSWTHNASWVGTEIRPLPA